MNFKCYPLRLSAMDRRVLLWLREPTKMVSGNLCPFTPTCLIERAIMENWDNAYYSGFKWTSTCSVICTRFASNLSHYAAFMKETAFLKTCLRFGVNGASKLNIPAFDLFLRDHAWFIFHLEHLPHIYLSLSIIAHKSLTVISGIILLQCSRNWISAGYSD